MGVVYEAVQQSLGRHVALKVLPCTGSAGSSQLERFRLEARAAARLHHTNIVPVFGVGEYDGVHYYAMQFIQGQGLDVIIDELRRLRDGAELDVTPRSRPGDAGGRLRPSAGDPDPGVHERPAGRDGLAPDPAASPAADRGRPASRATRHRRSRRRSRRTSGRLRPRRAARTRSCPTSPSSRRPGPSRILPQRRPRRPPGGRGAGLRARPGHPPPRHQAVEPADGRQGDRLGHRLRPGQGRGERRADADRRHRRHAALHGPGAVRRLVRPAERRLRAGSDALRAADAPPAVRGRRTGPG